MFNLPYLLLALNTATAEPTVPLRPMPKQLPDVQRIDGSSPVLKQQAEERKKKEEEEARKREEEAQNSVNSNSNTGDAGVAEARLGTNIGAKPANYPSLNGANTVEFNFPQGIDLMELIRLMAQATGRNFILGDDIKGKVTVSHTNR